MSQVYQYLNAKDKHITNHLKEEAKEGEDYLVVSKEVYEFLVSKYNGGPHIKRYGI